MDASLDKDNAKSAAPCMERHGGMAAISPRQTASGTTKEMPEIIGVTFPRTFTPDKTERARMRPWLSICITAQAHWNQP